METVKYWKKIRTQVAMKLINEWKIEQKVAENVCGVKL
jgi:hypothetical protein